MHDEDTATTQIPASDDELQALLVQRILELRFELNKARVRSDKGSILLLAVLLVLVIAGFVVTLAVALMPYTGSPHGIRAVPLVVSYVSAFGVVLFGYFSYSCFQKLITKIQGQSALDDVMKDGAAALDEAESALHEAQGDSSDEE